MYLLGTDVGVYNLPKTPQAAKPPPIGDLKPNPPERSPQSPHPDFPSAPGAHLAVRRAEQVAFSSQRVEPLSGLDVCVKRQFLGDQFLTLAAAGCVSIIGLYFPPFSALLPPYCAIDNGLTGIDRLTFH